MRTKRFNHKNRHSSTPEGMKTCFVTKEARPRAEMLRFVAAPDRTIVFDAAGKLPGRGLWLTADKDILAQAVSKKLFHKAAGKQVKIPPELAASVETALRERCLNLMGLCRKAGLLVFGYEAVKKAVGQREAVVAFEAMDASERGQNKIFKPDDTFPVYTLFSREEMGQIAGLEEVVHVALLKGGLSEEVSEIARKIGLYLNGQERKG